MFNWIEHAGWSHNGALLWLWSLSSSLPLW